MRTKTSPKKTLGNMTWMAMRVEGNVAMTKRLCHRAGMLVCWRLIQEMIGPNTRSQPVALVHHTLYREMANCSACPLTYKACQRLKRSKALTCRTRSAMSLGSEMKMYSPYKERSQKTPQPSDCAETRRCLSPLASSS
eukprot:765702-Hanusia_phi.AAC.4